MCDFYSKTHFSGHSRVIKVENTHYCDKSYTLQLKILTIFSLFFACLNSCNFFVSFFYGK